MEINYDTIKKFMEEEKYIAKDNVVWQMIKDIKKMENNNQKGQDIYAICLEGPPGAGKSFYAETYKKILEKVYDEEVEMIEYQCDGTTGKAELYEEIRVAAAIVGNQDEVIIEGKLVEAIEKVNTGKKVILFLDEFEKSRRETDSFMYGFLQKGIVITTQKGTLRVKPEYTKNLQVVLCKNDERELSDPLLRRCYIMRLEEMTPENFYKTINMNLPECDQDVRDVVALLYDKMYANKDEFQKFPSCSEGMKAIQDACDLIQLNAPEEVIYCDILSNLLKHPDDIQAFKDMFSKDTEIGTFVKKTITSKRKLEAEDNELRNEIYRKFYNKELQEITTLEEGYKIKEEQYKKIIENKDDTIRKLTEEKNNKFDSNLTMGEDKKNDYNLHMEELEFKESDINDEVIYYTPDLVGHKGSVFDEDEINEWHEIIKIKVNEEGSRLIERIVKEGKEFIKEVYKRANGTYSSIVDEYVVKEACEGRYKIISKKTIYVDGILLNADIEENNGDKFKDGFKIVARRIKENNEYFYKIYSNKKIQIKDYFGIRDTYANEYKYIGVYNFINILNKFKMILDYEENFLMLDRESISEKDKDKYLIVDKGLLKQGIIRYTESYDGNICAKNIAPYLYQIFSINHIQDDIKLKKGEFIRPDIYPFDGIDKYKEKDIQKIRLKEMYEKMIEDKENIYKMESRVGEER